MTTTTEDLQAALVKVDEIEAMLKLMETQRDELHDKYSKLVNDYWKVVTKLDKADQELSRVTHENARIKRGLRG